MVPRLARLPRRRRSRLALLALLIVGGAAAVAWAQHSDPVPDPAPTTAQSAAADAARQAAAGEVPTTPTRRARPRVDRSAATAVPNVPLAWQRVAAQAAAWPAPSDPPVIGREVELPTVPASRVRDTIGVNVDLWRTEYAYTDFSKVLRKVRELHLRHARVTMQPGATFGLSRMQQLGRAGVRLDVLMGDAFGRYGMAPFSALQHRLTDSVLPYVDAVEGTNEPDLAQRTDWVGKARAHQQQVAGAVRAERGRPVGVIGPSVGRLLSISKLGDVNGTADAANAHAYASGDEPAGALDQWLAANKVALPQGGPTIVTEAGFQDDTRQRKNHTPTSAKAAGVYVPRTILEAIRRGIPQVYLYELADRWSDPFGIDIAAHFGLLGDDLSPKPAWSSLVRLQRALLDNGRPDATAEPVHATIDEGPADLQVLALRRRDGTIALALWRTAPVWDGALGKDLGVAAKTVKVRLPARTEGALLTDVVSGERRRLASGSVVQVALGGDPVVVTGLQPTAG